MKCMEYRLAFLVFLTAHLFGRFAFPEKLRLASWSSYFSALVFYLLAMLLVLFPVLYSVTFFYASLLFASYVVFSLLYFLLNRKKERKWSFFLFEVLEVLFIAAFVYIFIQRWDALSEWRDVRMVLNKLSLDYSQIASYEALLVLLLPFSNALIKKILPKKGEEVEKHISGSFFGSVERVAYVLCFYAGGAVLAGIIFFSKIALYTLQVRKTPLWGARLFVGSILSFILSLLSYFLVAPFLYF